MSDQRRQSRPGHLGCAVVAIVAFSAGLLGGHYLHQWRSSARSGYSARCIRVVDTDTIEVVWIWGTNRVRLVGIDAPESKDGRKLRDQAERLGVDAGSLLAISATIIRQAGTALTGKRLRLVFPNRAIERDAFGRLLAYVEVNRSDFGAMLLRNGLVYPRVEGHPRKAEYLAMNDLAIEQKKGIYGLRRR